MPRFSRNKGFTLAEVMVAIAVFAVISAIALTLYQQLQKSFKQGENAAFQQQNTRIAFDRLIADLRMAGFNYNPDGDISRPDEQIEGMWQHAITIRGDFDYETADANTPESSLGGSGMPFGIVSTGNDEIVTYALGKPSGAGGTTISFEADVSQVPRDGTLETVQIPNVYQDMNSPPYTLYRITLKPGGTALSNIADKVPIADDIRSLQFNYYDSAGNALTTMAGGADDPNSIAQRSKIGKITVSVVGMTRDPDLAYFDPTDSNPASQNYRKFELSGDVTPRNIGYVGVPDLDLDDPSTPTGLTACPGHCEALWTYWNANPASEAVIKYEVTYGPDPINQANAQDVFSTNLLVGGLTTGSSYIVAVGAVDASGNVSDPRAYSSSYTVADATTPADPNSGLTATKISAGSAVANQIDLTWDRVTQNSNVLGCDLSPTPLRDLAGYRMYRGAAAMFDPNDPAQVQQSWGTTQLPGTMGAPAVSDASVVNCRTYHYVIQTEDDCGIRSAAARVSGEASTAIAPSVPTNIVAMDMGLGTAQLTWDAVNTDTGSPQGTILIDSYRVYRASVPTASDPNMAYYSLVYDGAVPIVGAPAFTDPNLPVLSPGMDYYYRITARDDCPNESALSMPALLTSCSFGGSVILTSPAGTSLSGPQTLYVNVSAGVVPVSATLRIAETSTGTIIYNQTSTTGPPYAFNWNTGGLPPGGYDIVATVTNNAGCAATDSLTVNVTGNLGACLVPSASTSLALVSGNKNQVLSYMITNNCGYDVELTGLRILWENNVCPTRLNNPLLAGWNFPYFPPTVDLTMLIGAAHFPAGSGFSPEAIFDLTTSPFYPYPLMNGMSTDVSYIFTEAMLGNCRGSTIGNRLTIDYGYVQVYGSGPGAFGASRITVIPDPASPGITLCDPTDPNCPLF